MAQLGGASRGYAHRVQEIMATNRRINAGVGSVVPYAEPTDAYWSSNEEIMRNDSHIIGIVNFMVNKLLVEGFVFTMGDTWLQPDPKMQSVLDRDYMDFAVDMFFFFYARGICVFTRYRTPEGVNVPRVVRWDDIQVEEVPVIGHRGVYTHTAKWRDTKMRQPLYLLEGGKAFQYGSRIDQSKPVLQQLYMMEEDRAAGARMMARPPIVLENAHALEPDRPAAHVIAEAPMVDLVLRAGSMLGKDNLNAMRMNNAVQSAVHGAALRRQRQDTGAPVPPHVRIRYAADAPAETRFTQVMQGYAQSRADTGKPDPAYAESHMRALQALHLINGIPPSALLQSHKTDTVSGVVEWHKTILRDTLALWQTIISDGLTEALYMMHAPEELGLRDVKPTYREQHARVIGDTAAEMPLGRIFAKDFKNKRIKMSLRSQLVVPPEVAQSLYNTGIISFENTQRLTLLAYGLPTWLVDATAKEPIRTEAQTRADLKFEADLNAAAKAAAQPAKPKKKKAAQAKKKTNTS